MDNSSPTTNMFAFDEKSEFNVSCAKDSAQSDQLQRVVRIINSLLRDENAMLALNRDSAKMFGSELHDDAIIKAIREAASVGYSYAVESSGQIKSANVKIIPHTMKDKNYRSPHLICFNDTFINIGSTASDVVKKRCILFHVVKLLHEIVHSLTASFLRATTAFKGVILAGSTSWNTPAIFGMVCLRKLLFPTFDPLSSKRSSGTSDCEK